MYLNRKCVAGKSRLSNYLTVQKYSVYSTQKQGRVTERDGGRRSVLRSRISTLLIIQGYIDKEMIPRTANNVTWFPWCLITHGNGVSSVT